MEEKEEIVMENEKEIHEVEEGAFFGVTEEEMTEENVPESEEE